jgi:hypothetical protein
MRDSDVVGAANEATIRASFDDAFECATGSSMR